MARLTAAARRALPKSAFAVPSKAPGPGSYPIPDAAHKRAAAGLAGMHHASGAVKAAIAHKKPGGGTMMPGQGSRSQHPHRNLGKWLHPKKGK